MEMFTLLLSLRARVCHPSTRVEAGLLGPCFKTGRMKPFRPQFYPLGHFLKGPPSSGQYHPLLVGGTFARIGSAPRTSKRGHYTRTNLRASLRHPGRIATPFAFLPTVSSTISLSFQSSFHLSLTVLVRYRSLVHI
jgi:hypothetical protein